MSKIYTIKREQLLKCDLEKAWNFFSNPDNLAAITPTELSFKVISKFHGDIIYPGQVIEYKIKPVLGIPLYWMTEITHVEHQNYFVDEQRHGPYSFWHHQHHFKQTVEGVQMTDIVHYKLPLWFLGDIAHSLFVRYQLKKIFDFRENMVKKVLDK